MSLSSELNKALRIKEIKRSKHLFPIKDSTFRNKDLIEGIKVIFSKDVTMSKVTKKFEKMFSKKIKTPYSLMVNSGSSANLLAFQCLINPYRKKRLKKGDEVLVPSICWPTSFWPIIQSGLKPVFVDVDRENFNIDLKDLKKKISKKTRALMLIHVLGVSTNMDKLMKILNKNRIFLIEDTCESIGAKYKNKFLGTFGDFSTFSFYFSHQISSVEGGMICCKNKQDEEVTKEELLKDKNEEEQKALKFFSGIPISEACFKKTFLTGDGYMDLVKAKVGGTDFKEKALNKLGIDEDMAKEIDPVNFEDFRYEYPKLEPFLGFHEGKFYTSMWEITWLFFGEEQVYVYNYSFDTTDETIQEKTQEYFYTDITAFTTQSDSVVKKIWQIEKSGCSSNKEEVDKTTTSDIFKIVVPGEAYVCAYPGTEADDQSVSAMKQKLRDMKKKGD